MKARIAPTRIRFPKLLLLLLACLLPFIGLLLASLEFSELEIYILQGISPICVLFIMLIGIKIREPAYSQLNLVFIFPYSLLSISLLKFFFGLQNIFLSLFIFLLYLGNIIMFFLPAGPKERHKYIFWRACLGLYLFPILFYNMDFVLVRLPLKGFIFLIILALNMLFYARELSRSYFEYKEHKIAGETDFLLLSQILGWILLGIGLNQEVGNWYVVLLFSVFVSISYIICMLEIFQSQSIGKFLILGSTILLLSTLLITMSALRSSDRAYLVVFFSVVTYELLLGVIMYGSFLTKFHKKIRNIVYFGFLCGVFYVIGALPSDFLPEVLSIEVENTNTILLPLSTIIQSLAAVLAILTTFITFVFIYVLSGKRNIVILKGEKNISVEEGAREPASKIADLVLLSFLLTTTLAVGYRLVKIIVSALTRMGSIGKNMSDNNLIIDVIRDSQATFWIVLAYLLIVGSVLIAYHITYRFRWKGMEKLIPELKGFIK